MALEKRIIDIPLTGGLSEKTGATILEAPSFATLENAVFTKVGHINARYGFVGVSTLANSAYFMAQNNGAAVARTTTGVEKYAENVGALSPSAGVGGAAILPCVPMDVTDRVVANGVLAPLSWDIARNSDSSIECVAWQDGANILTQVRDQFGNALGGPKELTASGANFFGKEVRVLCIGSEPGTFGVFSASSAGDLYGWYCTVSGATPTWSASVTIQAATATPFDATANTSGGGEFVVAFWNGSNTVLRRLGATLSTISSATITSSTGANSVGVKYSGGRLLAMYQTSGGTLYCASYSSSLVTTHFGHTALHVPTATTTSRLAACLNGSTWSVVWDDNEGLGYHEITTAGSVSGSATHVDSATVAAEPFVHNSVVHVPAAFTGSYFGAVMSVYGSGSSRMLGISGRFLSDRLAKYGRSHVVTWDDSEAANTCFAFAAPGSLNTIGALSVPSEIVRIGLELPGKASRFAEYDGNTYWGGGQLWCYDGVHAQESTPHMAPSILSASFVAGSPGVDLSAGDYSWKAVYEWEDANGILHRSAPSLSLTDTALADEIATVKVSKMYGTARDSAGQFAYWISLYRTVANGSVFYLSTRYPVNGLFSTTTGYWDIPDGTTDAALGEILYTEGDILEANAPPPVSDLCIARERMWLVNADRRSELWYSKKLARTIAPEFNAAQTLDIDRGEIVAVQGMDDKVIVFASEGIYAIYGEGPNDAGQGGTFTDPQPIVSDTGCVSREVAAGPFGIVFGGKRGAYLLTRGLEVKFIGQDVEDTLTRGDWRAACVAPDADEVRIATYGGSSLAWNYGTGQWSTWTGEGYQRHAATVADGYWVAAGTTQLRYMSPSLYGDTYAGTGTSKEMTVRTGWIRLGAIMGFQRVWKVKIFYEKEGTCGLVVKAQAGLTASEATIKTFTSTELGTAGTMVEVQMPTQKCDAMKLAFVSVNGEAGNTGRITIKGITLVCGVKAGTKPLASTSRA